MNKFREEVQKQTFDIKTQNIVSQPLQKKKTRVHIWVQLGYLKKNPIAKKLLESL